MEFVFIANSQKIAHNSPYIQGIGGSESALIHLTKELARLGHGVKLFCDCETPGLYSGVQYERLENFSPGKVGCEVFISFRMVDVFSYPLPGEIRCLWTQDAFDQSFVEPLKDKQIQKHIDQLICVSRWQAGTFEKYMQVPREKLWASRNGFNSSLYDRESAHRNFNRLVYTSTPFRGMDVLLEVFPRIKAEVHEAELHLFSSMKVYGVSDTDDNLFHGELNAVFIHRS